MKSAYELAMERFADDEKPSKPLTQEQKEALAAIETKFQAKIAEKELFLEKQILESRKQGDLKAVEQIQTQLRNERQRLTDEKEAEKERYRQSIAE